MMLKQLPVVLVILWSLAAFAEDSDVTDIESNIVVSTVISLQSKDFAQALQAHPLLMVKFYAPWCEHSKAIQPEFEDAAKLLKQEGSPIMLAEVDASKEKILAKREGAHSYPLLKWYKAGRPAGIYRQGREKLSLVDWLRSKTPSVAVEVSVLGMFPTRGSEGEKAFVETSYFFDHGVGFGLLRYLQGWAVRDTVWIRAKHFEGQEIFEGEFSVKNLAEFVTLHSSPHVVEFQADDWKTIFRDNRNKHFVFFANKESSEDYFSAVQSVAKDFKKEMMFVRVDVENPVNEKICQIFEIEASDAPTFRVATTAKRSIKKFKPEEENLTEENIRIFLAKVREGSLQPYSKKDQKSEDGSAEDVKNDDVKENSENELEKEEIKDEL